MTGLVAAMYALIAVSVLAAIYVGYMLFTMARDRVPYVPTPGWVIQWLTENAAVSGKATVIDIGCGDGRVLRALKRAYPTIRAIGYERNWHPYLLAKRVKGAGIEVRRQSFYQADLSEATVVYCYLLKSLMPKVQPLLERQLRPGTIIYSYAFQFPGWTPTRVIPNPEKPEASKLYVYSTISRSEVVV